jgi:NAD-dependent DNA ligase
MTTIRIKAAGLLKRLKRNQVMAIKCTLFERKAIEAKARKAKLTVSEYLRELGLTSKINFSNKAMPKEVLSFTATLNHMAANLNQIAKSVIVMTSLAHWNGQNSITIRPSERPCPAN